MKFKKPVVLLFLFLFLSCNILSAYAVEFNDVDASTTSGKAILRMTEAGILAGYPDGSFKPNDSIKRCEFIKILNKTLGLTSKGKGTSFLDIDGKEWFYDELLIAVEKGYINGYDDGEFKPENKITRQEFCKVLSSVLDIVELPFAKKITDEVSEWAKPFVWKVVSSRIMLLEPGDKFRAKEFITRSEVCEVLANYIIKATVDTGGTSTGNTENNNSGKEELSVILARVSDRLLNSIIPELKNNTQIEICNEIYDNINRYVKDNTYDYVSVAKATYLKYNTLTETEKTELQNAILKYNTLNDLNELKDFFFPDVNI